MSMIYLDHAATTPLRPEVRESFSAILESAPGNPSSSHRWGREARGALEKAREQVAAILRTSPREIIFTRGGTESINLALAGIAERHRDEGGGPAHFLRSSIEHSAVREPMEALTRQEGRVTPVALSDRGSFDREAMERALSHRDPTPILASFQMVNQETGIILPIEEIAEMCLRKGVPLHVDAVQAAGKIPIDLSRTAASLLTISGHKFGGPRGTGVLFIRTGVDLHPVLHGGGQERGLRPGTEDVAGAVALALALELATSSTESESARLSGLRAELEKGLQATIPGLRIHGEEALRAPHILSIGVPGIPRDILPNALDLEGIGASAGSACRSGSTAVSPVMAALYGDDADTFAPLRLSLGWSTTADEVREAVPRIAAVVERIRAAGVGGA